MENSFKKIEVLERALKNIKTTDCENVKQYLSIKENITNEIEKLKQVQELKSDVEVVSDVIVEVSKKAVDKVDSIFIKQKLLTNDRWLIHGLLAIYNNQTRDEKDELITKVTNGVGFNSVDSQILSSISEFVLKQMNKSKSIQNCLSDKQKAVVRKLLPKYSRQLSRIAKSISI